MSSVLARELEPSFGSNLAGRLIKSLVENFHLVKRMSRLFVYVDEIPIFHTGGKVGGIYERIPKYQST